MTSLRSFLFRDNFRVDHVDVSMCFRTVGRFENLVVGEAEIKGLLTLNDAGFLVS